MRKSPALGIAATTTALVVITGLLAACASGSTPQSIQRSQLTARQHVAVNWSQDHSEIWTWMRSHWGEMTDMHQHWNDPAWMRSHLPDYSWMRDHWNDMVWMHDHWTGMMWMHSQGMMGSSPGGMMGQTGT